MSQISMPMRILFVGAVVTLAAWFTILKPKPVEAEPPPVAAANAQPAAAATPQAPAARPVAATPIPADVLATLPADVARALTARKVLVLGVFSDDVATWRPMPDDDRYVRNALKKVNRYDGDVFVKRIGLAELSRYAPLVNDLAVHQSPSIVVVDRDLKGTVLTGYVDRVAINQAIADARRSTTYPNISDKYLSWANELCGRYEVRSTRWSLPTVPGSKARTKALERMHATVAAYRDAIARKPAPAKWKGFKAEWVDVMTMRERTFAEWVKARKGGVPQQAAVAKTFDTAAAVALDKRFNELGLTACAWNRRS